MAERKPTLDDKTPGRAVPPSALKRPRDSTWLEYDVDLLDNIKTTKRFASDSIAVDLASKMSMGTPLTTMSSIDGGGSPMLCSSADCSPAFPISNARNMPTAINHITSTIGPTFMDCRTPMPSRTTTNSSFLGPAAASCKMGPIPGEMLSRLPRQALTPLSLSDRLLTSPNDSNSRLTDLRKAALMRNLRLKHVDEKDELETVPDGDILDIKK